MADNKKNVSAIIGLSVPVVLIFLVIIAIYVPRAFAPAPRYNFIFGVGVFDYKKVSVQDGHLIVNDSVAPAPSSYTRPLRLFLYDVKNDTIREISVEEAQRFYLDTNRKSPDGYLLERDVRSYDVISYIFSNHDYYSWYLVGHGTSRKTNLSETADLWGFEFYGWIIGE